MSLKLNITMVFQEAPEGGYVAFIEEIPGINTQGKNLKETKLNLMDALKLTLEYHRSKMQKITGRRKKGMIKEKYEFVAA